MFSFQPICNYCRNGSCHLLLSLQVPQLYVIMYQIFYSHIFPGKHKIEIHVSVQMSVFTVRLNMAAVSNSTRASAGKFR